MFDKRIIIVDSLTIGLLFTFRFYNHEQTRLVMTFTILEQFQGTFAIGVSAKRDVLQQAGHAGLAVADEIVVTVDVEIQHLDAQRPGYVAEAQILQIHGEWIPVRIQMIVYDLRTIDDVP